MLLEAVHVAAGEIHGLLDDPVAADAAAERPQLLVEQVDLLSRQMRQLREAGKAPGVEQIRVDKGEPKPIEYLSQHRSLFTFGENIGTADLHIIAVEVKAVPGKRSKL